MRTKVHWENLIFETVQMGGTLVFLKDKGPSDLSLWIKPLLELFPGDIPFVLRSRRDLLSGKFETKAQDIVFVFSSQVEEVEALDSVLQGQRVLLEVNALAQEARFFDYIWSSCTLESWTQVFSGIREKWDEKGLVPEIRESHQAPCLFLDRDDVVVKNVPYNRDASKVELMPGIVDLISKAHQRGYWVALVTNQSGLGRGWISWREYQQVHQKTLELLAKSGCWLDECVWSGYIDQEDLPQGRLLAGQRKPRAGMFQLVNSKLRVDMANSMMVGDSASDLIAARSAGIKNLVLLSSAKLLKEEQKMTEFQKKYPDCHFRIAESLNAIEV